MPEVDIILLVGPKCVGKTRMGKVIATRWGTFISIEDFHLSHYRTLEEFERNRDASYEAFEKKIRLSLQTEKKPIIFEETAASSQAKKMISNLQHDYVIKFVKVTADLELCLNRLEKRESEFNFPRNQEFVISSHQRFLSETSQQYHFDFGINNNDLSDDEILREFEQFMKCN